MSSLPDAFGLAGLIAALRGQPLSGNSELITRKNLERRTSMAAHKQFSPGEAKQIGDALGIGYRLG
jgi:hypothetical protein